MLISFSIDLNQVKLSYKTKLTAASIFWLLFLSVDILKKSAFSYQDNYYLIFYYLLGFIIWFGITFPYYQLYTYTQRWNVIARVLFLIVLAPVIGSLKVVLSWLSFYLSLYLRGAIEASFFQFLSSQRSFDYVEASIIAWVLLLLFFLTEIYFKYESKKTEAAQLEAKLYQAQLEALKMQLQPHFLFNAHNTISMLIRTKRYDQAIEMTSKLSDLLRVTLESKSTQFIRIEEELSLLKKYIEIELIRFEDRLKVTVDIEDEILEYSIPNLLLQPIIENAFKHGVAKHLGEVFIDIKGFVSDDLIHFTISNSGPQLPVDYDTASNKGIGVTNVLDRLGKCFGQDFKFEYLNDTHGVTCKISIPITHD